MFYQYFVFTKKILQRFVSFRISLIFTYCLFVEKKLVTIISVLKIVQNVRKMAYPALSKEPNARNATIDTRMSLKQISVYC